MAQKFETESNYKRKKGLSFSWNFATQINRTDFYKMIVDSAFSPITYIISWKSAADII